MLSDPKMPTKLFCLFYATVERNRACAFMKKFKLTYPLKMKGIGCFAIFQHNPRLCKSFNCNSNRC